MPSVSISDLNGRQMDYERCLAAKIVLFFLFFFFFFLVLFFLFIIIIITVFYYLCYKIEHVGKNAGFCIHFVQNPSFLLHFCFLIMQYDVVSIFQIMIY